jgi:rfaE bifunctional protein kinase chain/domain
MIDFSRERLEVLFENFAHQRLVIVGDLMLDHYVWGKVTRVSPEAPVPVVEVQSESHRFGGAANVAYNVISLGAEAIPVGVIGQDAAGERLKSLFEEKAMSTGGLISVAGRPTTTKTRVIAHDQHVVRTDWEIKDPISSEIENRILEFLDSILSDVDGIIFEDYNKGLLTQHLIHQIVRMAGDRPTFVDPKYHHFFDYQNVTLFKPNRKEAEDRLGISLKTPSERQRAGAELLKRLDCRAVMITLGEEGLMLFESGSEGVQVPTRAVKVHDVSGAGDTVIATMAVSMTAGATLQEAATLANHAAGIVVGEVGIVPIEKERLYRAMIEDLPKSVK